jgi:hypothetical protein
MSDQRTGDFDPAIHAPWSVKRTWVPIFVVPDESWHVDASWEDGYFYAARLVVSKVNDPNAELKHHPMPAIEGIAGVYLFRHYLELALKHILFHSRWLKNENTNAHWTEIKNVAKTHSLRELWDTIKQERAGKISDEAWDWHDIPFVENCIYEVDAVDPDPGMRFRYHGKVFGVGRGPRPLRELYIDFERLEMQMDHVRDVLWSLDAWLLNTHGLNDEWEALQASF